MELHKKRNEAWKVAEDQYKCPYCDVIKSGKGICSHIARVHEGKIFSSGRNNSYHKQEYKDKKEKSFADTYDIKLGKFKIFKVICDKCKKEFEVEERELKFPSKEKYFCSRTCSNTREYTEETKEKMRATIAILNSKRIYKIYAKRCIDKLCPICNETFKSINKYCSKKCIRVSKSLHLPEKLKYRYLCRFNFNLKDYPDEFDFELIKQHGWYQASNKGNNLNGVSRDHMYSIDEGFKNKIDENIISHPANCKLVRHSDNSSKHTQCSISIEDLLEKIDCWNKKYADIV